MKRMVIAFSKSKNIVSIMSIVTFIIIMVQPFSAILDRQQSNDPCAGTSWADASTVLTSLHLSCLRATEAYVSMGEGNEIFRSLDNDSNSMSSNTSIPDNTAVNDFLIVETKTNVIN